MEQPPAAVFDVLLPKIVLGDVQGASMIPTRPIHNEFVLRAGHT
jgi:hypothetical protein